MRYYVSIHGFVCQSEYEPKNMDGLTEISEKEYEDLTKILREQEEQRARELKAFIEEEERKNGTLL